MIFMSVFALPALIALLTKIWIFVFAKKTNHTSQIFLWLLVFFAANNLSEFLVISQLLNNAVSESLLKSYYVALLFSLAYMCIFTMSVAYKDSHTKFNLLTIGIAALMALITFQTNWIVAGAISVDYTVTAVRGAYYFVFQLTVLTGFAWILYTLVRRYLNTLDIDVQLKCFYAGLTLSPIIIMSIIVMAMMQMGYQYTGAILLPFASTFLLLLVVLTEKNNDLIGIQSRLPFSEQRKAEKKILSIYRSHVDGDLSFCETKSAIERILVQSALDRSYNNVTLTANNLDIKRSTLYSIFNRLDMRRHAEED
ncbi:MAG: hypothetical protein ACJATK_002555 [Paracoccaceae bacterium]|jgi:hypothetical protein